MRIFSFYLVIICIFFTFGLSAENAPATTTGIITNATTAPGAVVVPVTVKNFVSIGAFTLTLKYNANLVTYISATPHTSFTGITVVNTVNGLQSKIVITWPQTAGGVTLPDETHLLDLTFTYISGNAALSWWFTSGNICQYKKYVSGSYIVLTDTPRSLYYISGGISSRAAPVTFAPVITNPVPGNVAIPVTVNNFTSVGAMTLNLEYNQAVLTYQGCTPNPGMVSNFIANAAIGPNGKMVVTISWYGNLSLANGSTVATINFAYSNTTGSYSGLEWLDTGSSCEYADITGNPYFDSPTATYYKNGAVYTQLSPKVWLPVKTDATASGAVSLPVLVNSFTNVRSFTLSFEYDPTVMTYGSFAPDAAFGSELTASDSPSGLKRKLVLTWSGTSNKTLPDGSSPGMVNFTYASGTSTLAWITSDATSCRFNDASGNACYDVPRATYYQNGLIGSHVAPVASAGQLSGTVGQPVTIPVKVYNYANIGQFAYAIDYDPGVLTWQSGSLVPAIGGTFSVSTAGVGRVIINWSGTAGSLTDDSNLINLTFTYNGGTTPLAWFDDGTSCKYAETSGGTTLYDTPGNAYYINGYVGINPLAAGFAANYTYIASGGTITLNDQSTGTPTAWNWSISPSTFYFTNGTTSASRNPQVKFTSDGVYAVTLIASKGTSSSIKIIKDYLFVGSHVFLTCPDNTAVAACQAQSDVNTAYATWLASAISTCVCNCALTNNSTGTPSACGGSATVTWTLASDCESPVNCTKTFTVTASTETLTCPSDFIMPTGQTQQTVDAAYNGWIASVIASGGCNTSLSNDGTGAPLASGGDVTVTWTLNSSCAPLTTACSATFAVMPTYTLGGTLKYNNLSETPMNNVSIRLQKNTTPRVDVTFITLADGSFTFGNLVDGIYKITPHITKAVDDINSTDAAQVNAWGTTTGTIEYTRFLAGDAADNLWLNSTDALKIQRHFVNGDLFDKGPWSYWKKGVTLNSNWDPMSKPTDFSLAINGANVVNYDLYAMCTGDFNGGFTPGFAKSANASIGLQYKETRMTRAGDEVELPLRILHASAVGAISIILNFPADLAEITGVSMNSNNANLTWTVKGDELRIGWFTLQPSWLEANSDLLIIHLKTAETFGPGDAIRLTLAASSLNELADGNYKVIPDAQLGVDVPEFSTNGAAGLSSRPPLTFASFPNPFTDNTVLTYYLPAEGKVSLKINDMPGHTLLTLVNKKEGSGKHSISLDALSLQPGVYFATVTLHHSDGEMFKTIKLVRSR